LWHSVSLELPRSAVSGQGFSQSPTRYGRFVGSACVPAVALEKMTCTIWARFAQTGESS
jgi:hypothetical protein